MGRRVADRSGARVLLVDDDEHLGRAVRRALVLDGFEVRNEQTAHGALHAAEVWGPDAMVMDIGLPDATGLLAIATLRARGHMAPICVLSARDTADDRVAGLEAGADDYLVKPFSVDELSARLRALLRRAHEFAVVEPPRLHAGDLVIAPAARRAWRGSRELHLTEREFDLLELLVRNRRAVLPRTLLVERVWSHTELASTKVVDVFVGYLRKKLELGGEPRVLHAVPGIGYVLR